MTWSSNSGGIWSRDFVPPSGINCTSSGSFALCTESVHSAGNGSKPSVRFAVAFSNSGGGSEDTLYRASEACKSIRKHPVESVAAIHLSHLESLPAPMPRTSMFRFGDQMLSKKLYSVMRVNTLSAEGTAPVHWSTPDKTPHQAMWLWDSCFHAIGRAAAAKAKNHAVPGSGNGDASLAWEFLYSMLSNAAPDGHVPIQASPWNGKLSGDTQPPLLALATAFVMEAGGVNKTSLEWALPRLERYIDWDFANRNFNSDALLAWHHATYSLKMLHRLPQSLGEELLF